MESPRWKSYFLVLVYALTGTGLLLVGREVVLARSADLQAAVEILTVTALVILLASSILLFFLAYRKRSLIVHLEGGSDKPDRPDREQFTRSLLDRSRRRNNQNDLVAWVLNELALRMEVESAVFLEAAPNRELVTASAIKGEQLKHTFTREGSHGAYQIPPRFLEESPIVLPLLEAAPASLSFPSLIEAGFGGAVFVHVGSSERLFGILGFLDAVRWQPTAEQLQFIQLAADLLGKEIDRIDELSAVRLVSSAATLLQESNYIEAGIQKSVQRICLHEDFVLGEYWAPDSTGTKLDRLDKWRDLQGPAAIDSRRDVETGIRQHHGFIGRSWSTHQLEWTFDEDELEPIRRGWPPGKAPQFGVAVPVLSQSEKELHGILAFFGSSPSSLRAARLDGILQTGELFAAYLNQQTRSEKIARMGEHYRAVAQDAIGHSGLAIAVIDPERRVVWANRAFEGLFSLDLTAVEETPVKDFYSELISPKIVDGAEFADAVLASYQAGEHLHGVELQLEDEANDATRWLEYWSRPIESGYHEGGRVDHFIDITRRKQLEQEVELRAQQQGTVADLAKRALSGLNTSYLFQQSVGLVQDLLNVEAVEILELDDDGNSLLPVAHARGEAIAPLDTTPVAADTSNILGYSLFSTGPVKVDDFDQEARFQPPPHVAGADFRSGAVAVIQGKPTTYGVLAAYAVAPRRFSAQDVAFLESVATVVADAVQRERGAEALRRTQDELEQRVSVRTKELRQSNEALKEEMMVREQAEASARATLRVSQKLAQTLDVDELLEELLRQTCGLLEARSGLAGLIRGEQVGPIKSLQDSRIQPFGADMVPDQKLLGWVIEHKQAYVANDAASDDLVDPELKEALGVESLLCQPIINREEEIVGFIQLHNRRGSKGFTEFDRERLNLVAQVASAALQNALVFGQVERAEQELTASKELFEEAQRLARLGSWDWDLVADELSWTRELYQIYGLDPEVEDINFGKFLELVDPEDREKIQARFDQAHKDHSAFEFEHRIVTPEGNRKILMNRGRVQADPTGKPVRMYGTAQDITGARLMEQALKEQRELYESLLEAQSDLGLGVIVTEGERVVYANEAISHICGFGLADLQDISSLLDLVVESGRATVARHLEVVRAGRATSTQAETTIRDREGRLHDIEYSLIGTSAGDQGRIFAIVRDITQRRQESEMLRSLLSTSKHLNANLNLPQLLDAMAQEGIHLADAQAGLVAFRQDDEFVSYAYFDGERRVDTESRWSVQTARIESLNEHREPIISNGRETKWDPSPPEGANEVQSLAIIPILDHERNLIGFFEFHNKANGTSFTDKDVERLTGLSQIAAIALQNGLAYQRLQEAEERLRTSEQRLRQFSKHLEEARERERSRISREIHDELGQALTGMKMDLVWITKRIQKLEPPEGVDQIERKADTMAELIEDTIQSVRRLASELRPSVLDDLGLLAAIEWQIGEFTRRTQIKCSLTTNVEQLTLDPKIATGAFRILQEALTNVARHAQASQVRIRLRNYEDHIELEVEDDGVGLPEGIEEQDSLGLVGMRERAHVLHGQLTVESSGGEGTIIRLTLPHQLPAQEEGSLD